MTTRGLSWALIALAAGAACNKVPITDVRARFTLADVSWFAEEQTMFVFYRVEAEQGLGPDSVVELTYRSDDQDQSWTPILELATVHTHLPVDCGINARCGSASLPVALPPRQVGVRLRYHREGEVTLDPPVNLNLVAEGPPQTSRSLLVYGVFDATNTQIQWRARHQFPTLRNEQAQELGLRRRFQMASPAFGEIDTDAALTNNPYGYAFAPACPQDLQPLGWAPIETQDRAVFDGNQLPLPASVSPVVCAQSTVTDAKGSFVAAALARKNPEVEPAFPTLRSPIRQNVQIGFLLHPCERTISDVHKQMQIQRLGLQTAQQICIDRWQGPDFATTLAATFRKTLDEVRVQGKDMVLTLALHHDDETKGLARVLERALEEVLVVERDKSTPRLSGAFVLDSYAYAVTRPQVASLVLWCPASLRSDLDEAPNVSEGCTVLPDNLELSLGPFSVANVPILPSRVQYLNFIKKYSEAQTGRMRTLTFRAPERTPLSENIALGDFATATFFNNEGITAAPTDAFSFCAGTPFGSAAVFKTGDEMVLAALADLPSFHRATPAANYPLGLAWEFPFLLRMDYEIVIAGGISAFSVTAPFGVGVPVGTNFGGELWQREAFPLSEVLLQCRRFCDHPTFDSAGVYNLNTDFVNGYQNRCYRPLFPTRAGGGFPLDP